MIRYNFYLKESKIILIFCFQLFVFSCHFNNEKKHVLVEEYYSNGRLKVIEINLKDSLKKAFRFDSLGNCLDILTTKNSKKEGEQLWFNENGYLQQKTIYTIGLPNGFSYQYYPTGAIKNYRYLVHGIENDLGIDYFDMHVPVVKSSLYFNGNGEIYFKQNFDSLSNLIGEEGKKPMTLKH